MMFRRKARSSPIASGEKPLYSLIPLMARRAPPCHGWVTSRAEKGAQMLAESLMALAALAGNTVVAAATTDAWEAARRGFARLLGHGEPGPDQDGRAAAG